MFLKKKYSFVLALAASFFWVEGSFSTLVLEKEAPLALTSPQKGLSACSRSLFSGIREKGPLSSQPSQTFSEVTSSSLSQDPDFFPSSSSSSSSFSESEFSSVERDSFIVSESPSRKHGRDENHAPNTPEKRLCTMADKNLRTPPSSSSVKYVVSPYTPNTVTQLKSRNLNPELLMDATLNLLTSPDKRLGGAPNMPPVGDPQIRQDVARKKIVVSPVARHAYEGRVSRRGFLTSIPFHGIEAPVVPYHGRMAFFPEPDETPQEAAERQAQQRALMEAARARQETFLQEHVHSQEHQMLTLFTQYLALRKERPGKMRRAEVEEILDQLLPQHGYTSVALQGYVVWYALHSLDLDKTESDTDRTNLYRMKRGVAPLGMDDQSMNLHHATRYDHLTHGTTSYLILLTETAHTVTFSGAIHFKKHPYWKPKNPVDRLLFDAVRVMILKDLAKHLGSGPDTTLETPPTTATPEYPLAPELFETLSEVFEE